MVTNSLSEQLLNDLGEDFAERLRRGETPEVSDYTSRVPAQQAREVEEFLDSIALLEDMKRGDDRTETQSDAIPKNFGRYRIERSLGEGGMGAVYLAHDSQLDRKVALKTPKFAKHSDPNLISRFYREARSAATLQHPNICPVYDVGEIDGIHYISMAYIQGRPLSDYIASKKFPPVASVVQVVRKVALALHEAHAQGVVHRDLKPANIMISRRNEPIVMDFGLARQFGTDDAEITDATTDKTTTRSRTKNVEARLTLDGAIVGSPGYMSPEQLRGEHLLIGPASDVYALGVLLYELLTGELPFPGDGTLMSIVNAVICDDPPDASVVREQLEPRIVAICQKAMAKRAEDRFESMQAFAVALTAVLKSDRDDGSTPKVSEVANLSVSPELVRTKEQYELARSLYQENQFAAAVSILEKMVAGAQQQSNQYTTWANDELPKARAKAERASRECDVTDSADDDGFWNEDFGAAAVATADYGQGTTRNTKRKSKTKQALPTWLYGVLAVSTVVIVVVIVATMAENANDNVASDQRIAESTMSSTSVQGTATPRHDVEQETPADFVESPVAESLTERGNESRPRRSATGRDTPGERLWRLDTDRDGKISKAEMSIPRLPPSGPVRQVADKFDTFDLVPRDGLLDRTEVQRLLRLLSRPGARDDRRPVRPIP